MSRMAKSGPEPAIVDALSCVENTVAVTGVDAVLAERGARYGKFRDHAALSQKLKAALMMHDPDKYDSMAPDQREALEMICHKMARIMNGDPNHAGNFIDIAGYATLVANRLEGKIV